MIEDFLIVCYQVTKVLFSKVLVHQCFLQGALVILVRLSWCCRVCSTPSFLSSSDVPLNFPSKYLVQHLASSIKTLCTFGVVFGTFLNPDATGIGVGLSSLSRSDRIVSPASCRCSEGFDVCPGDSLPLNSSSLKRHWWWRQSVNLCHQPVYSPPAINDSPRDSDHVVDGFFCPTCPAVLTS